MKVSTATLWICCLVFPFAACSSPVPWGQQVGRRSTGAVQPPPRFDKGTPLITPGCTVRPFLRDEAAVQRVLAREYPDELRDRQITGTADVWMLIDDEGFVLESALSKSSGYPAIDEAAVGAALSFEFEADALDSCQSPMWVAVPIRLGPGTD